MVDDITPEEVKQYIKSTRLLLVEAWAPTCGPCKDLAPILEKLEEEYSDNSDLKIVKVNTKDHIGFATENNIFALPCVLIFFEGEPAKYTTETNLGETKVLDRLLGLRPLEHYDDVICTLLNIA